MKVAIVHYWLTNWRGGEKVLESLAALFPEADIYAHVVDLAVVEDSPLKGRSIRTTFIQRLPFAQRWYQKYLPLMPLALEQLDLRGYDLVISSESGPAKGVVVPPGVHHLCYCHTPMRYVWDMYHEYLAHAGWLTRILMRPLIHYLRLWDRLSADRVDHFVANSAFVSKRIQKFYRRESVVIHPAIDMSEFVLSPEHDDFYLVVGALVRYKKADLAVHAFNQLGIPLVVIGDGELYSEIKAVAGPNIKILGRQSREVVLDHYRRCKALIFPGVEDFGIVPLEAMATGKPVIAYGEGGALETVVNGLTGLHFFEQTKDSLVAAVDRMERAEVQFNASAIREHAAKFDSVRFRTELLAFIRKTTGLLV
jgi:glycosyltransferase involved in cell wall biosynthesis